MAANRRKNYDQLLTNLKARRSDVDEYGFIQKSVLSESFGKKDIPQTVKYVFESMQPVGDEYTIKTYD